MGRVARPQLQIYIREVHARLVQKLSVVPKLAPKMTLNRNYESHTGSWCRPWRIKRHGAAFDFLLVKSNNIQERARHDASVLRSV